jgi:hypothetical protein
MNDQYEVEIKSLLGAKEHADKLRNALQNIDPAMKLVGKGSQLNHYFLPPADAKQFDLLKKVLMPILPEDTHKALARIAEHGTKVSIRTRRTDTKTLFIIKASVSDDTSSNGVARIEFEAPVQISLDELDKILMIKSASRIKQNGHESARSTKLPVSMFASIKMPDTDNWRSLKKLLGASRR